MTWRLAGYDHAYWLCTAIDSLMLLAWANLDTLAGSQQKILMLDLNREFPRKNEEKLPRAIVRMPKFAGCRRHAFFDDAQLSRFDQVPAIAIGTIQAAPRIVFG